MRAELDGPPDVERHQSDHGDQVDKAPHDDNRNVEGQPGLFVANVREDRLAEYEQDEAEHGR